MNRWLKLLVATLVLTLSGSMAWATVNDCNVRDVVPPGVTVAGRSLSGMTEAQARATIAASVSQPMLRPLTVSGDGKSWTLDPQGIVNIDEGAMLAEAYSTLRAASFVGRLDSELRGTPLTVDVKPRYSVDTSAIADWVARTSAEVDRKPKDAIRRISGYKFTISPSADGAHVERDASVQAIAEALGAQAALSNADRTASLDITPIKPKVTEASYKKAIIVSLSDCRIYLYDGAKLVKQYSCAPGQPDWPTPTGDFKVVSKEKYAPWYNPHSAWSAGMPDVIEGGPYNPMGDTKIGIDYPGVYMHAVPPSEFDSIGSHASHGCMRMMPSSVHDLYERVKIGDPVFIRH